MVITNPYFNYYHWKSTYKHYLIKELLDTKSLNIKALLRENSKKEVLEKLYFLWLLDK